MILVIYAFYFLINPAEIYQFFQRLKFLFLKFSQLFVHFYFISKNLYYFLSSSDLGFNLLIFFQRLKTEIAIRGRQGWELLPTVTNNWDYFPLFFQPSNICVVNSLYEIPFVGNTLYGFSFPDWTLIVIHTNEHFLKCIPKNTSPMKCTQALWSNEFGKCYTLDLAF